MAHKKAGGSTNNGRDSISKRLGVKLFGGQAARAGNIIVRHCDDINLTTNDLSDLGKISEVVEKFEVVSAAILSRDKKCKVIGFGRWSEKTDWPIAWLGTIKL